MPKAVPNSKEAFVLSAMVGHLFGYEAASTVYTRSNRAAGSNGMVGFALDALRELVTCKDLKERIKEMVDALPSGSGIDCGTTLERDDCKPGKLVLSLSYHHMAESGMYDGWTEHKVIVTPSFDGIDMRITGPNRNDIKDYLYEVYHYALTQEISID
jgi:hypothetical protein